MAKKFPIFPICFIATLVLFSSAQAQSYKSKENLVGSVKSIQIEMKFLHDESAAEGRVRHLSGLRTYDYNGNLTSSEDFYMYGKASWGKDTYTYDLLGRVIEKVHDINGSISKVTYSY